MEAKSEVSRESERHKKKYRVTLPLWGGGGMGDKDACGSLSYWCRYFSDILIADKEFPSSLRAWPVPNGPVSAYFLPSSPSFSPHHTPLPTIPPPSPRPYSSLFDRPWAWFSNRFTAMPKSSSGVKTAINPRKVTVWQLNLTLSLVWSNLCLWSMPETRGRSLNWAN